MSLTDTARTIRDRWHSLSENTQSVVAGAGSGLALTGLHAASPSGPNIVFGMITALPVIFSFTPPKWLQAAVIGTGVFLGANAAINAATAPDAPTPTVRPVAVAAKP